MSKWFLLDENGQPLNPLVNFSRRLERTTDELLGFLRGIIADDTVTEGEVFALAKWLCINAETNVWPFNVLIERIERVLADQRVDQAEATELHELFKQILGQDSTNLEIEGNASTQLPLTEPPPEVVYPERIFVFSGRFVSGTRRWCESVVRERGGLPESSITRETNYLIIGALGSRDWIHTPFGRKIEKAVEYRGKGYDISIISEKHWISSLGRST